jgi:hypothetical protein
MRLRSAGGAPKAYIGLATQTIGVSGKPIYQPSERIRKTNAGGRVSMSHTWRSPPGRSARGAGWPEDISWRHAENDEFKAVEILGTSDFGSNFMPAGTRVRGGLKIIERCFGNSRAERWRSGG